jgi:hypothetical protein
VRLACWLAGVPPRKCSSECDEELEEAARLTGNPPGWTKARPTEASARRGECEDGRLEGGMDIQAGSQQREHDAAHGEGFNCQNVGNEEANTVLANSHVLAARQSRSLRASWSSGVLSFSPVCVSVSRFCTTPIKNN